MLLLVAVLAASGWVDVHVHSDPDMMPRSIDAVDAARLAKQRGARAILLKNHFEPTASLAYLTQGRAGDRGVRRDRAQPLGGRT